MAMDSRRAQWVVWNDEQGLADSEKLQARNNIGAAALASLAASFESRAPSYNWSAGEVCTYGGALWMFDADHSGVWTGADAHEYTFSELAKNGWVDVSNQLEAMPGITLSSKSFYVNEFIGLYRFGLKAYGSTLTSNTIELVKINYSGFVRSSGIAMALGPNDTQLNTPIPFGVYDDDFAGHEHRIVVWPSLSNQAAGATGISGFGVLK